jgi:hypothetical protein
MASTSRCWARPGRWAKRSPQGRTATAPTGGASREDRLQADQHRPRPDRRDRRPEDLREAQGTGRRPGAAKPGAPRVLLAEAGRRPAGRGSTVRDRGVPPILRVERGSQDSNLESPVLPCNGSVSIVKSPSRSRPTVASSTLRCGGPCDCALLSKQSPGRGYRDPNESDPSKRQIKPVLSMEGAKLMRRNAQHDDPRAAGHPEAADHHEHGDLKPRPETKVERIGHMGNNQGKAQRKASKEVSAQDWPAGLLCALEVARR